MNGCRIPDLHFASVSDVIIRLLLHGYKCVNCMYDFTLMRHDFVWTGRMGASSNNNGIKYVETGRLQINGELTIKHRLASRILSANVEHWIDQ